MFHNSNSQERIILWNAFHFTKEHPMIAQSHEKLKINDNNNKKWVLMTDAVYSIMTKCIAYCPSNWDEFIFAWIEIMPEAWGTDQ